jgi:hypothetical protein
MTKGEGNLSPEESSLISSARALDEDLQAKSLSAVGDASTPRADSAALFNEQQGIKQKTWVDIFSVFGTSRRSWAARAKSAKRRLNALSAKIARVAELVI